MGTYGLGTLLSNMVRNDPRTGEKINKLRKSYEGQIKPFGLPGRIKPYAEPRDKDEAGKLRLLATLPEEEYQKSRGNLNIEVTDNLRSKLESAMKLNPGKMPKSINVEWEDTLGHEKQRPALPQPPMQPMAPQPRLPNGIKQPQTSTSADKMKTRGKKRSYDDSSFFGYADGYSDVEDHSDRDYDRRKQRRRE